MLQLRHHCGVSSILLSSMISLLAEQLHFDTASRASIDWMSIEYSVGIFATGNENIYKKKIYIYIYIYYI